MFDIGTMSYMVPFHPNNIKLPTFYLLLPSFFSTCLIRLNSYPQKNFFDFYFASSLRAASASLLTWAFTSSRDAIFTVGRRK